MQCENSSVSATNASVAMAKYRKARAALTPESSEFDIDWTCALLGAALSYGPWTENQILQICWTMKATILDWAGRGV